MVYEKKLIIIPQRDGWLRIKNKYSVRHINSKEKLLEYISEWYDSLELHKEGEQEE